MKKTVAKVAVGALAAVTIFAFTETAEAHHPEVEAASVCIEPDESLISITAKAWQVEEADHRINPNVQVFIGNNINVIADSWLKIGEGHFGPDNNYSFVVNNIQKNAVGSVTVRVVSVAPWGPNGEYQSVGNTREAVINLSDDCVGVTTTTAPSVVTTPDTTPPSQTTIVRDRETPPATSIVKMPNFPG